MNLSQEIAAFLGDSQDWKGFGEILNGVGAKITAEKASQVYTANYAENAENASRDMEEQVRLGRKRMIASSLSKLVHGNYVECQDSERPVHERLYRKGSGKKALLADNPDDLLTLLNEIQEGFKQLQPSPFETQDFQKDCRSLKRIILTVRKRSES